MTTVPGGWWTAIAAAVGLLVVFLPLLVALRRRRGRAAAQLAAQESHDAAVEAFRETTGQVRTRREELVRLLELARSERLDLALTAGAEDGAEDPLLSGFYRDLAAAREDQERREALTLNLQRAIMGQEILTPEAPVPPAPLPRLPRRVRVQAEAWYAERAAMLPELAALAVPEPAQVVLPRQQHRDAAAAQASESSVLAARP